MEVVRIVLEVSQEKYIPENVEVVRSIGGVVRKVHTRKCGGCKKYWRCHKKSTYQKMWRL